MNVVVLFGRVTADVELRTYGKGKSATKVVKFNLAVDRNEDVTDFPRVTAFGKTAELLDRYAKKGARLLVHGKIQTGSFEDEDGSKVWTTDVIATRVTIIDWPDEDDEFDEPQKKRSRK